MYLIVGANGFLGSYLISVILNETNESIIATTRNKQEVFNNDNRITWVQCDIEERTSVERLSVLIKKELHPVKVIFLSAFHHPDKVDEFPQLAWNINITSLSYFINKLSNVKCFFYPSTDTVYGESINGYHFSEEDNLSPVNLYGIQKRTAEQVVLGYGYNVVRFPFLIAPSLLKHKKHFCDEIVNTLQRNKPIKMFSDSFRSSLDFYTAAFLLIKLCENYTIEMPKILNISGDKDLSKYDVALEIAKILNLNSKLILPISTSESNDIFKAIRARSTLMDNSLLKSILKLEEINLNLNWIKEVL